MACVALVIFGFCYAFHLYYYETEDLFVVKDDYSNIFIDTGNTLTPDLVREFIGITPGTNLFLIDIDQKRDQLMQKAPSIKEVSIIRPSQATLRISIIEREPIARVMIDGRVVDNEGVVFVRYTRTSGLPIIIGSKIIKETKPGDNLRGMDMAAVMLAESTFRTECRSRFMAVDTSNSRYLLLTFPDSRRAKITWADMESRSEKSKRLMIDQYDKLVNAMNNDIGMQFMMFDAQIPGRIIGRSTNF